MVHVCMGMRIRIRSFIDWEIFEKYHSSLMVSVVSVGGFFFFVSRSEIYEIDDICILYSFVTYLVKVYNVL